MLHLATNIPAACLEGKRDFELREKAYFALTWGSGVEEDLAVVAERFLLQTRAYWQTWVKHCSIPTLFQAETIRSALALKLHCYEDTGAILAATTTSLPEEFGGQRNWDYRFCWLRDAHFTLSAFHSIGHFEEMEGFLKFLLGIVRARTGAGKSLAPVYNLGGRLPLPEQEHPAWAGYLGNAPVRTNNQAAEHVQNDVYGEMVLTLAPIFFDERFLHLRTPEHEELLEELAVLCHESISRPDAGLWEVRNGWKEHSFTNLMCWAGLERITRIRAQGWLRRLPFDPSQARDLAAAALAAGAQEGVLRNGPSDPSLDASLALGAILRIGDREIALRTVQEVRQKLALGADGEAASFFYRYNRPDDFGTPGSAFVICSFWVAQALAQLGEKEEARRILAHATGAANHVGLYSEHFDPRRRLQLGNFPQAYSHVGLINAAFAASPAWSEVL